MTKKTYQYTAYATIKILYLLDIDAKDVYEAEKIAKDSAFKNWVINPDEPEEDYVIDVVNIQPRRKTND